MDQDEWRGIGRFADSAVARIPPFDAVAIELAVLWDDGRSSAMIIAPNIVLAARADARAIAEMSRTHIERGLGWSWTPSRVSAAIRDPATNVAVIRDRTRLAGFGIMHYGDRRAHLALLAVAPDRRHQGLGAALLAWLEQCADTAGIGHIRVEARSDNPGALAFYQRQGYREVAQVPGYYRGILDAIRLQKGLWLQHGGEARWPFISIT